MKKSRDGVRMKFCLPNRLHAISMRRIYDEYQNDDARSTEKTLSANQKTKRSSIARKTALKLIHNESQVKRFRDGSFVLHLYKDPYINCTPAECRTKKKKPHRKSKLCSLQTADHRLAMAWQKKK